MLKNKTPVSMLSLPFVKRTSLATAFLLFSHQATMAGDLVGRVSDTTGAQSLAGAEISLTGTNYRAITDSDGQFRIPSLAAGNYTVNIRYVGAREFSQ